MFLGGESLTHFASNEDDPDLQEQPAGLGSDEEEEMDDLLIRPSDKLILVGHTEEEQSNLEVYIYEEDKANLYVHHDFPLPSFPLSLAWLSKDPRIEHEDPSSNLVAIGTFQTGQGIGSPPTQPIASSLSRGVCHHPSALSMHTPPAPATHNRH